MMSLPRVYFHGMVNGYLSALAVQNFARGEILWGTINLITVAGLLFMVVALNKPPGIRNHQ